MAILSKVVAFSENLNFTKDSTVQYYLHFQMNNKSKRHMGTSIIDVPRFLAIFDLPTLPYSITSDCGGYLGPSYLP